MEKGDCIVILKQPGLKSDLELVGGKIKEIIDTINEIIDYLTELKIKD